MMSAGGFSTSSRRLCFLRRHRTRNVNHNIHQKLEILPELMMLQNVNMINYHMETKVETKLRRMTSALRP